MFHMLKLVVDQIIARVGEGEKHSNPSIPGGKVIEEEFLLCKNNVCVHVQPSKEYFREEEHIPGYFSLKYLHRGHDHPDLILCWVPNSLLTVSLTDEESSKSLDSSTSSVKEADEQDSSELLQNEKQNGEISHESNSVVTLNTSLRSDRSLSSPSSPRHNPLNKFDTPFGGIFAVNLTDMKTLKLFYSNDKFTSGQLVLGNYESQYKVFHFHHGGMDKLTEVFDKWKGCVVESDGDPLETKQKIYFIARLRVTKVNGENGKELHPEEGYHQPMNLVMWRSFLNPMGQIEDVNNFRKHVFFAGLNPEVRPEAWKFLLYYYPVQSTSFERDGMKKEKEDQYEGFIKTRHALKGEDYEKFWKSVQFTVDKDVVRTDRSNPFFSGDDNPNVQKMRNILLNYAIYNPDMGYTQGMSDLLAPLLSTIQDEVDTFWCFVGLMEFSLFATTPTDDSMDQSLGFLRELLRIMHPEFYIHCLMQDEDLCLLFCHRWLVLCFKREFIWPELMTIWEACWSRYQTDYFHIFICVAMLMLYGKKCLDKKMKIDQMLEYFMNMAMKFDGSAVLREARRLLYKFRTFQTIPCTLRGLLSGPGVWDGGIAPEVECISNHRRCCFEAKDKAKNTEEKPTVKENGDTENNFGESTVIVGEEKDPHSASSDKSTDKELPEINSKNVDAHSFEADEVKSKAEKNLTLTKRCSSTLGEDKLDVSE